MTPTPLTPNPDLYGMLDLVPLTPFPGTPFAHDIPATPGLEYDYCCFCPVHGIHRTVSNLMATLHERVAREEAELRMLAEASHPSTHHDDASSSSEEAEEEQEADDTYPPALPMAIVRSINIGSVHWSELIAAMRHAGIRIETFPATTKFPELTDAVTIPASGDNYDKQFSTQVTSIMKRLKARNDRIFGNATCFYYRNNSNARKREQVHRIDVRLFLMIGGLCPSGKKTSNFSLPDPLLRQLKEALVYFSKHSSFDAGEVQAEDIMPPSTTANGTRKRKRAAVESDAAQDLAELNALLLEMADLQNKYNDKFKTLQRFIKRQRRE